MTKFSKFFFCVFATFLTLNIFISGALASESQIATVTGSTVNLRNGPGLQNKVLAKVVKGNKLKILSKDGDWLKVSAPNNKVGWIKSNYVSTKSTIVSRGGSRSSSIGTSIVSYAKEFLGVEYVWGGSSPQGFDCSGFVWYVYKNFGIQLNRVSTDQAQQGVAVDKADLKTGDLVFFNTNHGNRINHSGIYIGDGMFIDASSGRGEVIISSLNTGFYAETYVTARRFF